MIQPLVQYTGKSGEKDASGNQDFYHFFLIISLHKMVYSYLGCKVTLGCVFQLQVQRLCQHSATVVLDKIR
jgi:hypothetical protein